MYIPARFQSRIAGLRLNGKLNTVLRRDEFEEESWCARYARSTLPFCCLFFVLPIENLSYNNVYKEKILI